MPAYRPGDKLTIDAGALNRELVLENGAVAGSVNVNHNHYRTAAPTAAGCGG